jgi:hypothetical protein
MRSAVESSTRPIPQLLNNLKEAYTNVFSLECAVYRELRGPHNKQARKDLANYLGHPEISNVVHLADLVRAHFDQLTLF